MRPLSNWMIVTYQLDIRHQHLGLIAICYTDVALARSDRDTKFFSGQVVKKAKGVII
jgi:hypothetical protein